MGKVDVHFTQREKRKYSLLEQPQRMHPGGGKGWDSSQASRRDLGCASLAIVIVV